MNMGPVNLPLAPLAAPPEPPQNLRDSEHAEKSRREDDDFERLMRKELEKKRAAAELIPMPLMPWLLRENQVPTDDGEAIQAAGQVDEQGKSTRRAFAATLTGRTQQSNKPEVDSDDLEVVVAPVKRSDDDTVAPIQVMVAPGLPPIQPASLKPGEPVPLVQFPQVVVGQVQKMVKDNQPITQLDFVISPPHVGPINLNVALQNGAVSVILTVPNAKAAQAMEGQSGAISAILQAHNLTPGQVRVVTAATGKHGAGATGQQGDQPGFNFFGGGRKRAAGPDDMTAGTT